MSLSPPGFIIAAPRSGAGKTTVALGLMRAFARRGLAVQAFKNGPDYIDPAFHAVATGRPGFNLDSWAMDWPLIDHLAAQAQGCDLSIMEGSMGLFDGGARAGAAGHGATADLAARLGWPVILVLDVSGQAQSAAATALGFARMRADVTVAGVILNRVASDRHARLIGDALHAIGLPTLGILRRDAMPTFEERHLGLVQAGEVPALDAHLDRLAEAIAAACDLDAIKALAVSLRQPDRRPGLEPGSRGGEAPETLTTRSRLKAGMTQSMGITPPAQRIALARDDAFSFLYPHLLAGWREAGAEILPFSPLADQGPAMSADLAWLPGGYPELHAGRLAANGNFLEGLRRFAAEKPVHGECGGYMVLGAGLTDADGTRHAMTGLLGLETDFSKRRLHLGYRLARTLRPSPLGPAGTMLRGHEFHYARVVDTGSDAPLFAIEDAEGKPVTEGGTGRGTVSGSFFHLIA